MVRDRKTARGKRGVQKRRAAAEGTRPEAGGEHRMPRVERDPEIADEVPWSERVTAYDEAHFVVYLRLLDAIADGATDAEMSRIVLGIDPVLEPERACKALTTHVERARWMAKSGYRDLLDE